VGTADRVHTLLVVLVMVVLLMLGLRLGLGALLRLLLEEAAVVVGVVAVVGGWDGGL
jgi:hypothetical protein